MRRSTTSRPRKSCARSSADSESESRKRQLPVLAIIAGDFRCNTVQLMWIRCCCMDVGGAFDFAQDEVNRSWHKQISLILSEVEGPTDAYPTPSCPPQMNSIYFRC